MVTQDLSSQDGACTNNQHIKAVFPQTSCFVPCFTKLVTISQLAFIFKNLCKSYKVTNIKICSKSTEKFYFCTHSITVHFLTCVGSVLISLVPHCLLHNGTLKQLCAFVCSSSFSIAPKIAH